MKIGITCYSTYGGSGVLATELGMALARRGHEVHFITDSMPHRLHREFNANVFFHQVEIFEYSVFRESPYTIALAARMAEVVRQENLDLLHVHYAIPHAISAFLASELLGDQKVPIVTTLHGTDVTLVAQDAGMRDLICLGINRSAAVTAVSDYLKDVSTQEFQPEKPIQRVYNFADTELFKPRCAQGGRPKVIQGVNCDDSVTAFLHMSNFRPVKRTQDVLRIFSRVHREYESTRLLMVGEGPELPSCRRLAQDMGIADKVCFLGKQEDIAALLPMGDILLFPSESESFGLAALEAMACEIPVIASTSGGLPEVVSHDECGFLHEIGDVEGMTASALKLIRDPELRQAMGKKGREIALAQFTVDKILPEYEKIYCSVL